MTFYGGYLIEKCFSLDGKLKLKKLEIFFTKTIMVVLQKLKTLHIGDSFEKMANKDHKKYLSILMNSKHQTKKSENTTYINDSNFCYSLVP